MSAEVDKALGPMFSSSAGALAILRAAARDSCHAAALPDEQVCRDLARYAQWVALAAAHAPSGLPMITTDGQCVNTAGAGACCVGVPQTETDDDPLEHDMHARASSVASGPRLW